MQIFPQTHLLLDALFFAEATTASARDTVQWARFLGMVHLYSMSGLHLYAFLGMLEWALSRLGAFFKVRASVVQRTAYVVAFGVWFLLWHAQDYRPGMLKPLILVGLRTFGRLAGLRYGRFAPLVVAVALGSLVSPRGSLVYFLAVAGGVLGRTHLKMALYSWLTVVPVDLWEHRAVSLFTPIMSLLSIPLVTSLMIPARLCEFFGADMTVVWQWSEKTLELFFAFGEIVGNLWACPLWASVTGFLLAGGLAVARPKSNWFPTATLVLCFLTRLWPAAATTSVVQLNVGQGDAALIKHGDGTASVVDAGTPFSSRSRWLKVLLHHGVTRLHGILLTHGDADHVGGLSYLQRVIQNHGRFPFPTATACGGIGGNAVMKGTVVPLAQGAYVNLGDSNAIQEKRFLPFLREQLVHNSCTILKVSHHGSRTSSTPELLKLCKNAEAWVSAGRKNPYGHPHPATMRKLREFKMNIKSTAESGDLVSPP